MSTTSLMTLIGSIVMLTAWALVGHRIKASPAGANLQVRLLRSFFLFMGLFLLCVFLPQIALSIAPASFPFWMAWGYTMGHVLVYIGLLQMLRLTLSMVPRLAGVQKYAIAAVAGIEVLTTVLTVITMAFGTQPQYDYQQHVVLLNVSPVVGIPIAIIGLVTMLPTAILLLMNGVHNPSARLRSSLLGGGIIIVTIAGPLHDVARSWQLYTIGDIVLIIGFLVLYTGIVYRFEERLVPARAAQPSSRVAA